MAGNALPTPSESSSHGGVLSTTTVAADDRWTGFAFVTPTYRAVPPCVALPLPPPLPLPSPALNLSSPSLDVALAPVHPNLAVYEGIHQLADAAHSNDLLPPDVATSVPRAATFPDQSSSSSSSLHSEKADRRTTDNTHTVSVSVSASCDSAFFPATSSASGASPPKLQLPLQKTTAPILLPSSSPPFSSSSKSSFSSSSSSARSFIGGAVSEPGGACTPLSDFSNGNGWGSECETALRPVAVDVLGPPFPVHLRVSTENVT